MDPDVSGAGLGGMAGIILRPVGGAAGGRPAHFWLAAAAPGAFCVLGGYWTFDLEQVDMVGGPGMVGGHFCACSAFGSNLGVSRFNLGV